MKKYVQKLTVALLLTLVGGMNAWAQGWNFTLAYEYGTKKVPFTFNSSTHRYEVTGLSMNKFDEFWVEDDAGIYLGGWNLDQEGSLGYDYDCYLTNETNQGRAHDASGQNFVIGATSNNLTIAIIPTRVVTVEGLPATKYTLSKGGEFIRVNNRNYYLDVTVDKETATSANGYQFTITDESGITYGIGTDGSSEVTNENKNFLLSRSDLGTVTPLTIRKAGKYTFSINLGNPKSPSLKVEKVTEFYFCEPGVDEIPNKYTIFTDNQDGTYSYSKRITRAMVSNNSFSFCFSDSDTGDNHYGVPEDKVEISETNHENIPLSIDGYMLQIPVFKAGNYNFVIDNSSNTPLLNVNIDPFTYYLLVPGENGSLPYYDRFTVNEDGTYSLHLAVTNTMVSEAPYTFLLSDDENNVYGAFTQQKSIDEAVGHSIPIFTAPQDFYRYEIQNPGNFTFTIYEEESPQTNLGLKVEKEEGVTTSIQGIPTSQEDHIIYNLNGQRVKQTHKGIYVVNGKKIVVK
jgi:hypothetical protein